MSLKETIGAIRARLHEGSELHSLQGEAVEQTARTLPLMRAVELFRETLRLRDSILVDLHVAQLGEEKGIELQGQALADKGESLAGYAKPEKAKLQLEVIEKYLTEENKAEHGLRAAPASKAAVSLGNLIEAANDRLRILTDVLNRRYETEGLPAEVQELKGRIAEVTREVWTLRKAYTDARDVYNKSGACMGALGAEFEADVTAKAGALAAAEARVGALREGLFTSWALR
jgi:hypothetical protein